jgi:hypothetical protein
MVLSTQQALLIAMACARVAQNNTVIVLQIVEEEEEQRHQQEEHQSTGDKRGVVGPSTRDKRLKLRRDLALDAIQRDYLGIPGSMDRTLMGADFKLIFRISRRRFQCLMEDFMANQIEFYKCKPLVNGNPVSSIEARILIAIKALAYGVPAYAFRDYFQINLGPGNQECHLSHLAVSSYDVVRRRKEYWS